MDESELVLRHAWTLAILWGVGFHCFGVRRIKNAATQHPKKAPGARMLLNAYTVITVGPWILIGIGTLTGHLSSIADVLRPEPGNLIAAAFWALGILLSWVAAVLFLAPKGAAFILAHAPLFVRTPLNRGMLGFNGILALVVTPLLCWYVYTL